MGHLYFLYCVHPGTAAAVAAAAALGWWSTQKQGSTQRPQQNIQHEAKTPIKKPGPSLTTPNIIYQAPPPDYASRLPALRPTIQLPPAVRGSVAAQLLLRHAPPPPSLRAAAPSAVCIKPSACLPVPYPSTQHVGGGPCGWTAAGLRFTPIKLLAAAAAAAAIVLGVSADPAAFAPTIHFKWHNKQQQQQQQQQQADLTVTGTAQHMDGLLTAQLPAADTAALSAAAHVANRHRQYQAWVQQHLPSVLRAKHNELQQLQGLQDQLSGMQGVLGRAGPEVGAVLGAAQVCLSEEVESLQIQVEALRGEL